MSEQCLGHLKVIELCNLVTGPYCTKLLADLGAEVIKIESPLTGEDARKRGPFHKDNPHPEKSGQFLYLNTNKLGITLDVRTSTGCRLFRELIEQTDILVEDNPPEAMKELGLSYEELRQVNPKLIMTSVSPFGQTGPYRDYRAYQMNTYHAGGEGFLLPMMSPDLSREPVRGGSLVSDCICALSSAIAILAAAYYMNATGLGQYIDMSKQDVMTTMVLLDIAMYGNLGVIRNRLKRPLLMPLPMETKDGHIMMSALTDREWKSLVDFMGNPTWADDERFNQWLNRHLSGDDINPHVEEFVQQYNKDELFHRLQSNAIAAVPVNTAEDTAKSEQLKSRGFFAEIEHPEAGTLRYPTASYKYSDTIWGAEKAAPLLGEHNGLVYCERLGYSKQELVKMRETGVI